MSPSEQAHLDAVVAFLDAAGAKPMTLPQIKAAGKNRPRVYAEVMVMQRLSDGPRRTSMPSENSEWRILVRAVAEDYTNALRVRHSVSALHEARLTIDGEDFYVERSMTDDPIAEDDGWWSGVSEFTY